MSDTGTAIYEAFMSKNVEDSNLEEANLVDTTDRIGIATELLANAITPYGLDRGTDATGGVVMSLTEAVMGVSSALVQIADAIAGLKEGSDG